VLFVLIRASCSPSSRFGEEIVGTAVPVDERWLACRLVSASILMTMPVLAFVSRLRL
jgi:hypothetical protein